MSILADGMSIFKRNRENIPEKIEWEEVNSRETKTDMLQIKNKLDKYKSQKNNIKLVSIFPHKLQLKTSYLGLK